MARLAVVTIVCGPFFKQMAEVTHPTIKEYAEKIGADFVVWGEEEAKSHIHPDFVKLDFHKLFERYDRILYIDTDIIVREDAPSLFDVVPEDKLGLFEEGGIMPRRSAVLQYCHEAGLDPRHWDGKYYNAGVIVASKQHAPVFSRPPREILNFYAQTCINMQISLSGFKVHELSHKFNRMICMDKLTGESRHDCYFLHYAGVLREKETLLLKLIAHDILQWRSDAPLFKYKRSVALVVAGGLGDQICAEPVARYLRDHVYPGDKIIITTHYPEVFTHLGLPTYINNSPIQNPQEYTELYTMQPASHPFSELVSHPLTHAVDYASLCAISSQLPIKDRKITLQYDNEHIERVFDLISAWKGDSVRSGIVLVHPGRGWPSKTFPADVWQSYVDALVNDGFNVAVIGKRVADDQGVVEIDTSRCIDLIDKLSLKELFALVSISKVLISNDSAPVHVAGAFDTCHIGLIATCKHPDYVLPYRGPALVNYYNAMALEREQLYLDYSRKPSEAMPVTIVDCSEERMRECLPPAETILSFTRSACGRRRSYDYLPSEDKM